MSATNRGAVRRERDFYETPAWATKALLRHVLVGHRVVDAGCGTYAISAVLAESGRAVAAVDIEPGPTPPPKVRALQADFLQTSRAHSVGDVVMNPPYSLAAEFIRHALHIVDPDALVCALLRLNFLGSAASRIDLVGPDCGLERVLVLGRRPSFTGGGTDATEYAWFVWRSTHEGPAALSVIPPLECR